MSEALPDFVLTLSCPDRVGIVHAVSGFIAAQGCNILDSQQFGDLDSGRFFMRVHFVAGHALTTSTTLEYAFAGAAATFDMQWSLHDTSRRDRVLIMVSKQDHCLNDLLYRHRIGALPAVVAAVASNHRDCEPMAAAGGVPFYHLPIEPGLRAEQEQRLRELVGDLAIDLVVLARYMQVLSPELCGEFAGRAINIHHSFLPGFTGAKPYHQAHERGVKLIGATAHYVTPELDDGPIIEQEVARVDHTATPGKLAALGRDLETVALARAVSWHLERRIILNGAKTVVFR
jgi:formyltetrahydrofolate deformylase